jgi:hypothetical protein
MVAEHPKLGVGLGRMGCLFTHPVERITVCTFDVYATEVVPRRRFLVRSSCCQ